MQRLQRARVPPVSARGQNFEFATEPKTSIEFPTTLDVWYATRSPIYSPDTLGSAPLHKLARFCRWPSPMVPSFIGSSLHPWSSPLLFYSLVLSCCVQHRCMLLWGSAED